ncbi:MAG: class I SAM-dependent methyltransferase [Nitrospiraceae bacterium]|nr:class I SAM-dependent methyltransferase [Nitrospiraceae bacterium]
MMSFADNHENLPVPLLLERQKVIDGYRSVSALYPWIPPMIIWRGWERAAYSLFALREPVLDLGCGDGSFFRFLWPNIANVVGLDADQRVAEAAKASGVYRNVHCGPADTLSLEAGTFNTVFANCSLEHMNNIDGVLQNIARCLRPGGGFLLSVITDAWASWDMLPLLVGLAGDKRRAGLLREQYVSFHRHVNIFSLETWIACLRRAGLTVTHHVPIVPEYTGRLFLLLDHVWHIAYGSGEAGDLMVDSFRSMPNFKEALEQILSGMLHMETDSSRCCGAVFHAIK